MSIEARNIIVEKGEKLGLFHGADILDWFVTADGYRHEFTGVCNRTDYIKRYVREGMEEAAFSLLAPGLLYKSTPIYQDNHVERR